MNKIFVALLVLSSIVSCRNQPEQKIGYSEQSCQFNSSSYYTAIADKGVVKVEEKQEKKSVCPDDMVEIEGDYCPNVEEICLYDVDIYGKKLSGPHKEFGRCGEFKYPTRCLSENKIHKHYCIDKYEIPNIKDQVPTSWLNYTDAENFCKSRDKRLCTNSEWEFSCEGVGENPQPYPYGDGYHRDYTACNTDNPIPKGIDVFKATSHNTEMARKLDAMLVPSGSMNRCVSPTGVYDQIGNLDEWTVNETHEGYKSGLKGGHIWGVRARCRPMTTAHNGIAPPKGAGFSWYEVSGRCCSNI